MTKQARRVLRQQRYRAVRRDCRRGLSRESSVAHPVFMFHEVTIKVLLRGGTRVHFGDDRVIEIVDLHRGLSLGLTNPASPVSLTGGGLDVG